MLNVEHNGRVFVAETTDDLAAMGVPQSEIEAEVSRNRAKSVSAECRKRILAVASSEAQINLAAAVGVISGKTASARSEDEKTILAGAEAANGWVAAMRSAVAVLSADASADFTADAAWPEVPSDALAAIQNF